MRIGSVHDIDQTHGTRVTVLAALLALGVSACDQHSTARQHVEKNQVANDTVLNAQAAAVSSTGAQVPVSDHTLAVNVKAALMESAALNATTIEVSAKEGIVTLSGTTNTHTRRDLAGYLALKVNGVIAVRNRISVIRSS